MNAFEDINAIAVKSRVGRVATTAAGVMAAAWRSSRLGRWIGDATALFAMTPSTKRIRWYAFVVCSAALGHLAIRAAMPKAILPATPPALFIAIAVVAMAVAWQPAAFQRAWRASRLARAFR
jgi:hypothetical protein